MPQFTREYTERLREHRKRRLKATSYSVFNQRYVDEDPFESFFCAHDNFAFYCELCFFQSCWVDF
jgi:hypothetical protein